MSSPVHCDNCGKVGRCKLSQAAPKDWYFVELRTDPDCEQDEVFIIAACSEACMQLPWKPGPGKLSEGLMSARGRDFEVLESE